jgi:hypothetical protein
MIYENWPVDAGLAKAGYGSGQGFPANVLTLARGGLLSGHLIHMGLLVATLLRFAQGRQQTATDNGRQLE